MYINRQEQSLINRTRGMNTADGPDYKIRTKLFFVCSLSIVLTMIYNFWLI